MNNDHFITSEEASDNFVGIRFINGIPKVVFPHGFRISNNENERRKDVFRLLAVLQYFTKHTDGEKFNGCDGNISTIPLASYQYLIHDFLAHGYYAEREIRYVKSAEGKINWKRTINNEKPWLDGNNIIYLNYQVKKNQKKTDSMIAKIHQYCVYQSFLKFGWLYLSSAYLPKEPMLRYNKKLFISVLEQSLNSTFNDFKRKLFQSMINVISDVNENVDIKNFAIGVYKFENVWERLIDYMFGETDKDKYFPHATWHIIKNEKVSKSSALEPDTIMWYNGKIYVLDAKYYRYGLTERQSDLPQTNSIQKQITYGKYISGLGYASEKNVFNAFIMPFNAQGDTTLKFVGVGTADWEKYTADTLNCAYVIAILLDTRHIITEYSRRNAVEIEQLATLIEESLSKYRAVQQEK